MLKEIESIEAAALSIGARASDLNDLLRLSDTAAAMLRSSVMRAYTARAKPDELGRMIDEFNRVTLAPMLPVGRG